MSELRITTNNHARPIIYWWELTEDEQAEFDWADEDSMFARYKGRLYCISDFMRTDNHFGEEWDGYESDSFFSGVLARFSDECGYSDGHPSPDYDDKQHYSMKHDPNTFGDFVVMGWYCS